jgi:predicted lipoprotein
MQKLTATLVAATLTAEAILPHHNAHAMPHTEVDAPMRTTREGNSPGTRLNGGIKLTIITPEDLVTMPHTGQHLSLKEIRSKLDRT